MTTVRCQPFVRRALLPLLVAALPLAAQAPHVAHPHWIVSSRAVFAPAGAVPVRLVAAAATVRIVGATATTTIEFELHNPAGTQQEAVLLLPVPEDAAVSGFAFEGAAAEPSARILPRDEARRLYDEITGRMRDPALLEFVDWRCLRSSVFPVPAGGRQRVRIAYEHVLETDGSRVDYVLPRSEMLSQDVPWSIAADLKSAAPVDLVYSPSHELAIDRRGPCDVRVRVTEASRREPGAFRLCFTTTADAARPTAALYAYPDPSIGGGWFLLLAGAGRPPRDATLRREVTIVLDRSGSMAGVKLEQAKAAALQVLEGLQDGEGIQVLDYGNSVESAFPQPVAKTKTTLAAARAHLGALRPLGGTNLHDALLEALKAPAMPGTLPLVLFLTDGLPTVGRTREQDLRDLVAKGNPHRRRVFCFGVGNDVNVPLLDRIAEDSRATVTYVLPDEDVEVKVARTFARLDRPVLAEPVLCCKDEHGAAAARITDVLPARLPDLFAGDQLVLLGQYRGDSDLRFELSGATPAGDRHFAFTLPVRTAKTRHAFVPRLWASRQIAFLVDELRQRGGDSSVPLGAVASEPFADPRLRELRDEILRLSTRFGVLGEYTAFLATEGSNLADWRLLAEQCQGELGRRALATRSGAAAVNQGCNLWAQKGQERANPYNAYFAPDMKVVETTTIQQVCDRAFFRRGDRWIDGNSVANQRLEPDERIEAGSARFQALLGRLQAQGRAGVLSLRGEILLELDGKNVLVTPPAGSPIPTTPVSVETIR